MGEIKAGETSNERSNSICVNWFLITTYHFPDGSTVQTSEYVGTTCSEQCGDGTYASLCPDGSSSSGNGSNDSDYETDESHVATGTYQGVVYWIDQGNGGGTCKATQTLKASLHTTHSERDNIFSCIFVRSDIYSNSLGATSTLSTYNATNLNTQTVSVATAGNIVYPDNSYIPFTNTTSIGLGDVTWHY